MLINAKPTRLVGVSAWVAGSRRHSERLVALLSHGLFPDFLAGDATDGEGRGFQAVARNGFAAHGTNAIGLLFDGQKGIVNGAQTLVLIVSAIEVGGAVEGVGTVFFLILFVGLTQSIGTGGVELCFNGRTVGEQALAEDFQGGIA